MNLQVKKYSVEKYQQPISGNIYKEAFFIIQNNHFMVVRNHSLQCNTDQRVAEHIKNELYPDA